MVVGDTVQMQVVTVLRARLTDHNSANRPAADGNWIYPDWPNPTLTKNSYPRISVTDFDMQSSVDDLARNHKTVQTVQIDVWVWNEPNSPQLLTISSVVHSGNKLLALVAEDVRAALIANQDDFKDDTKVLHNMAFVAFRDMPPVPPSPRIIRKLIQVRFTYL